MKNYVETSCRCEKCIRMCKHYPCWPTPEEAMTLMDRGYGPRLGMDYRDIVTEWDDELEESVILKPKVSVICPARKGREGRYRIGYEGHCTFLTGHPDYLCELHDLGLKPLEGRVCHHSNDQDPHEDIAEMWNSDEGRTAVERWEREFEL